MDFIESKLIGSSVEEVINVAFEDFVNDLERFKKVVNVNIIDMYGSLR